MNDKFGIIYEAALVGYFKVQR